MTLDHAALRAAALAATPGPWHDAGYDENKGDEGWWIQAAQPGGAVACALPYNPRGRQDATFIAASSPDVVLALQDENAELRAAVADLRRLVERAQDIAQLSEDSDVDRWELAVGVVLNRTAHLTEKP